MGEATLPGQWCELCDWASFKPISLYISSARRQNREAACPVGSSKRDPPAMKGACTGPRKCRRAVPSSITVQSARDGVARCDAGRWCDQISTRSYSGAGLRDCAGAATIYRNYFVPIEAARARPRGGNLTGSLTLGAALSYVGRTCLSAIYGR